jgi:hypothetical protein
MMDTRGGAVSVSYMTPKLIPLASMIFSRRGIRRDQMNIQGKMAKKKSQALDQTKRGKSACVALPRIRGEFVPPSPILIGLIWIFHFPGVLIGSQLALIGVVWFQSMITHATDVPAVISTSIHSDILCHLSWTTRRRKEAMDSLAKQFPVMANVLATYVQKMAWEELSGGRIQKFLPRP